MGAPGKSCESSGTVRSAVKTASLLQGAGVSVGGRAVLGVLGMRVKPGWGVAVGLKAGAVGVGIRVAAELVGGVWVGVVAESQAQINRAMRSRVNLFMPEIILQKRNMTV